MTGWLLLIDTSLPFLRLLAALVVAQAFLVALLSCRPYRRVLDNTMAAGTQVLFVCIFLGGMLCRLHTDIATDTDGSPELAHRYLGLRSSDEVVIMMICVCFAMIGLLILTVAAAEYFNRVQRQREARWQVVTTDPPTVQWRTTGAFACFLSQCAL